MPDHGNDSFDLLFSSQDPYAAMGARVWELMAPYHQELQGWLVRAHFATGSKDRARDPEDCAAEVLYAVYRRCEAFSPREFAARFPTLDALRGYCYICAWNAVQRDWLRARAALSLDAVNCSSPFVEHGLVHEYWERVQREVARRVDALQAGSAQGMASKELECVVFCVVRPDVTGYSTTELSQRRFLVEAFADLVIREHLAQCLGGSILGFLDANMESLCADRSRTAASNRVMEGAAILASWAGSAPPQGRSWKRGRRQR